MSVLGRALRDSVETQGAELAQEVLRRLAAAVLLADDEPEVAADHAAVARDLVPRLGPVRELAGVSAYRAGRFEEAARDLRAARRLTGEADLLPLIADCERARGRPEQALVLADDPARGDLLPADRAELLLVVAGAHRDLGDPERAVAVLRPLLRVEDPTVVLRVRYALADALEEAGRADEAAAELALVAEADVAGVTDAAERLGLLEVDPGPDHGTDAEVEPEVAGDDPGSGG